MTKAATAITFPCVITITAEKTKLPKATKLVAVKQVKTRWGAENFLAHDGKNAHWVQCKNAEVDNKAKIDADILAMAEEAFDMKSFYVMVEPTGKTAKNGAPRVKIGGKSVLASPKAGVVLTDANVAKVPQWILTRNKVDIGPLSSKPVQEALQQAFEAANEVPVELTEPEAA
jgi:hypothetical protein